MISFAVGGAIPVVAMILSPRPIAIWVTGAAVVLAMITTGLVSARLGRIPVIPSIVRNVAGGLLAMAVTYGVGNLAGTQL